MAEIMTMEAFDEWSKANLVGADEFDGAEFIKFMFPKHLHLVTKEMCDKAGKMAKQNNDLNAITAEIGQMMGISSNDEAVEAVADKTNEFGADGDNAKKATKGGKSRKKNLPKRAANRVIVEAARNLGTTTYGAVATIISQRGAVIGYVTATNDKIDIVKKTTKEGDSDRAETRFKARMSGPSGCKAFIVAVPADALEQINLKLSGQIDEDHLDVEAAQNPNQPFVLVSYPTQSFVSMFLTSIACGSIREDESLFEPYVMKSRSPKGVTVTSLDSIDDVMGKINKDDAIVAGQCALYTTTSYKQDGVGFQTPVTKVKHTFRTKLVTPSNYIAARIFSTIPIEATYPSELCEEYTKAYLDKFVNRRLSNGNLIDTVAPDENNITFTTEANGTVKISRNTFFTTSPDESYWTHNKLDHWFYRDAQGNPQKVDPIGEGLVQKVATMSKKGTTQVRLAYKELKPEKGVDNYTLEFGPGGRHEKIGAAAAKYGVNITYEFMEDLFREAALIKDAKKSDKSSEKSSPNPRGRFAFGINAVASSEAYKTALMNALNSAKEK